MDTVYVKTEFSDSDSDDTSMQTDSWEPGENEKTATTNSLSEKSKKQYETVYKSFMDWKSTQRDIEDFLAEDVLLRYFDFLSQKHKSSSLWPFYSMLRSTLNAKHNVNIETYFNLHAFLKRKSEGYQAANIKTFSLNNIHKFINEAPDRKYLAVKVALIMGTMGGCRANQLHSLNLENVQDIGTALIIAIPSHKSKDIRNFTITGQFYDICKKYMDLRPLDCSCPAFFLNYENGKCTSVNIGRNKLGRMGKEIAKYLKLPNPELYTGRCFRKSSVLLSSSLLIDSDGDVITMKRKRELNSEVPPVQIDEVHHVKSPPPMDQQSTISEPVEEAEPSTSHEDVNTTYKEPTTPKSFQIIKCSNFTVNFYFNDKEK